MILNIDPPVLHNFLCDTPFNVLSFEWAINNKISKICEIVTLRKKHFLNKNSASLEFLELLKDTDIMFFMLLTDDTQVISTVHCLNITQYH